jgi:hypothetical protein
MARDVPAVSASALRVSFVAEPRSDAIELAHFPDHGIVAIGEPIAATAPPADGTGLEILHLSEDSGLEAEAWLADPVGSLEVRLQADRIIWRPGRAAIVGPPSHRDDCVQGLVYFGFFDGELRRLEADIESWWGPARAHIPLTHQVDRADVRRWPEINRATELATLARMRFAVIGHALEKLPPSLPGLAGRLVTDLFNRGEVHDRLVYVDDRLEILEDLYELANDRLSEFHYFRSEYMLEVLIILVLVLEVVVMGYAAL